MELQAEIRHSGEPASGGSEASSFFFSPETARISVPADLPAGLAAQIAAFVGRRSSSRSNCGMRFAPSMGPAWANARGCLDNWQQARLRGLPRSKNGRRTSVEDWPACRTCRGRRAAPVARRTGRAHFLVP